MKKDTIYVLDTNVLINNPRAFLEYEANDVVVIPYKVIEELEKHKLDPGFLGKSIKECSQELMSVIKGADDTTLKSGIELENGSILKSFSCKSLKYIESVGSIKSGDDHILASAVGLSKEHQDCDVKLVSNDMLLKIRANTFGIPCEGTFEHKDTRTLDKIYSGYRALEVDVDVASKFWEEHSNDKLKFSMSPEQIGIKGKLNPNEYVVLKDPKRDINKGPWAILKSVKDKRKLRIVDEIRFNKIQPLNVEQAIAADMLMDEDIHLASMMGVAGSGKTLLALEAGLEQVLDQKRYEKLVVLRPIHTVGKDIGYLPGDLKEKLEPWLAPIKDNLKFLLSDNKPKKKSKQGSDKQQMKTLDYLFDREIIEIEALAYIRGRSIDNAYIIVDEVQNTNQHELKTILTRVGKNTKIVLTGDVEQSDRSDLCVMTNGLAIAIEKFKKHGIAGHVTLREGVRSELSELAARIL